ncbi:histidine phosphatase family protein [Paenibacillus sp. GYB003]|uniref:histidine phosphatase family protein n=1 Tax=Paenibacillus sp. GYB003 TaxID=2994392 RepID=UPI002F962758
MSTTFFLVRHAVKEKAIGDVSITAEGIRQAQATARCFDRVPIAAIIASPLRRAKETASHIAMRKKAAVSEDARLRERANWGDLPEQTFAEFVAMWERCTRDPAYMPPVGDSARQAGERLASFLSETAERHPSGSSIVAVTHGGLITDFLVHAFSGDELDVWHPNFAAAQSDLVPECSITKLTYEDGIFKLNVFASAEHVSSLGNGEE